MQGKCETCRFRQAGAVTDWMTERAREAAEAVLDELLAATDPTMMTPEECEEIILQAFTNLATESYARGCADQHERTKAAAADVAQSMVALTSSHAAYTIAAAIEKMERPV